MVYRKLKGAGQFSLHDDEFNKVPEVVLAYPENKFRTEQIKKELDRIEYLATILYLFPEPSSGQALKTDS